MPMPFIPRSFKPDGMVDLAGNANEALTAASATKHTPPRWHSGKASASRAEDPGFEYRLRRDFFGVESFQ